MTTDRYVYQNPEGDIAIAAGDTTTMLSGIKRPGATLIQILPGDSPVGPTANVAVASPRPKKRRGRPAGALTRGTDPRREDIIVRHWQANKGQLFTMERAAAELSQRATFEGLNEKEYRRALDNQRHKARRRRT